MQGKLSLLSSLFASLLIVIIVISLGAMSQDEGEVRYTSGQYFEFVYLILVEHRM